MKKLAIAIAALLVLVVFAGWNVWHAVYEPVTETPSLVDQGRQQLHAQLEQATAREAEIEKQDWDTITLLRELIQAHQHRIDQLRENGQAGEIVAHDHDAIARIEKRIADLQAQQAALPPAQAGDTAATAVADSPQAAIAGPSASPHPAAPQGTKPQGTPASKTQPAPAPSSSSTRPTAPQTTKPAPKTSAVPASTTPAAPQPQPQAY